MSESLEAFAFTVRWDSKRGAYVVSKPKLEEAKVVPFDIANDMFEALRKCQKALAMMVTPGSIEQTSVVHAFAVATEAEVAARSALQKAAPPEIQS